MKKRHVSLEEAKKALKNDKVFIAGNKYNVVQTGKYNSGWTITIPQEWEIDVNGNPIVPDIYYARECTDLTDGMNMDFDAKCEVLFGKYRKSMSGKPVFEVTDPKEAKHVMVVADWGGAFSKTRGNYTREVTNPDVLEFRRATSNGGGLGVDYYIVPIDFINAPIERDVTEIVKKEQEKIEKERNERSEKVERIEREREISLSNKESVMAQVEQMLREYEEKYGEEIDVNFDQYTFSISKFWIYNTKYSQEAVKEVKECIEKRSAKKEEEKKAEEAKKRIMPKFKEYEQALSDIKATFEYGTEEFKVCFLTAGLPETHYDYFGRAYLAGGNVELSYQYTEEGFSKFISYLQKAMDDYKERKNAERQQEEATKKKVQQARAEEEAKELGYPSNFEFDNRLCGATGLSHAYVITKEGDIREPDDNILRNPNHRHHYSDKRSCILGADGTQIYNQILPGDIILSYRKSCTREPFVVEIEWADQEPTEDQLLVMIDILEELIPENDKGFYMTGAKDYNEWSNSNEPIKDYKAWILERIRERLKEFRSTLKQKEERAVSLKGIEKSVDKQNGIKTSADC